MPQRSGQNRTDSIPLGSAKSASLDPESRRRMANYMSAFDQPGFQRGDTNTAMEDIEAEFYELSQISFHAWPFFATSREHKENERFQL